MQDTKAGPIWCIHVHTGHFGARPLAPKLQNRNQQSLQSSLQSGRLQTEAPCHEESAQSAQSHSSQTSQDHPGSLLAPNLWLFQQLLRIFPLPLFVPEISKNLERSWNLKARFSAHYVLIFLILSLKAAAGHCAVGKGGGMTCSTFWILLPCLCPRITFYHHGAPSLLPASWINTCETAKLKGHSLRKRTFSSALQRRSSRSSMQSSGKSGSIGSICQ